MSQWLRGPLASPWAEEVPGCPSVCTWAGGGGLDSEPQGRGGHMVRSHQGPER